MPNSKHSLAKIILELLAETFDVVTLQAIYSSPYYIGTLGGVGKIYPKYYFRQTIKRLEHRGLVTISGPKVRIKITRKGLNFFQNRKTDKIILKKQDKWDTFWRFVIFDIPEKQHLLRDAFRRKLKELGFREVQKSVWVYPYPCRNELATLCQLYKLEKFVSLVEGKYLGDDSKLKTMFKLRRVLNQ